MVVLVAEKVVAMPKLRPLPHPTTYARSILPNELSVVVLVVSMVSIQLEYHPSLNLYHHNSTPVYAKGIPQIFFLPNFGTSIVTDFEFEF